MLALPEASPKSRLAPWNPLPELKLDTTGNNAGGRSISQDIGKSEYLGMLDTEKEKYVGPYYNFVEPTTSSKNTVSTLQLNGA